MNQQPPKTITVNCGELCNTNVCSASEINLIDSKINGLDANITINFEKFIKNPNDLSARILDLLRIAAYAFCADRLGDRGDRSSVDNQSWSRSFHFNVPVIDLAFWNNIKTKAALAELLQFITGDRKYEFEFASFSSNEPIDKQICFISESEVSGFEADSTDVMLFSGGLDSLAGVIQRLNEHQNRNVCLVSHKSNTTVVHTQKKVTQYLKEKYPGRIFTYGFECHNKKIASSIEETQRTRIFLFSAIAFAICSYYGKNGFYVYENSITSINLPKQGDVMNARASRTTHPKTIGLLNIFFRLLNPNFEVWVPYSMLTKAEVMEVYKKFGEKSIITSSVSCSSSRTKPGQVTHCGRCSQCIDRRFAIYAADLADYDVVYAANFINDIPDDETKQRLLYTLRLACEEKVGTPQDLFTNYPTEIFNVLEYWQGDNPDDQLVEIHDLFRRYGESIMRAISKMRSENEDLALPVNSNSLLYLVSNREYLNTPYQLRVNEIDDILKKGIPLIFQNEKPKDENDFNSKVQGLLSAKGKFTREYPVLQFGITSYRADHAQESLLIESKYLRGSTSPSIVTSGAAADITLIPGTYAIMFVIYDPERKIHDDSTYIHELEQKRRNCFVRIFR